MYPKPCVEEQLGIVGRGEGWCIRGIMVSFMGCVRTQRLLEGELDNLMFHAYKSPPTHTLGASAFQ